MWEYLTSWYEAGADYTQYVFSATGEVYDSVTGEIVGWYDETTGAITDTAGVVIDTVTGAVVDVYDDAKSGADRLVDLAESGIDATTAGLKTADKAVNVAAFVIIPLVGLGLFYWFGGGRMFK